MILLHYAAVSGEIPSGLINKLGILIDNRQYIFYRSKFKDFFICYRQDGMIGYQIRASGIDFLEANYLNTYNHFINNANYNRRRTTKAPYKRRRYQSAAYMYYFLDAIGIDYLRYDLKRCFIPSCVLKQEALLSNCGTENLNREDHQLKSSKIMGSIINESYMYNIYVFMDYLPNLEKSTEYRAAEIINAKYRYERRVTDKPVKTIFFARNTIKQCEIAKRILQIKRLINTRSIDDKNTFFKDFDMDLFDELYIIPMDDKGEKEINLLLNREETERLIRKQLNKYQKEPTYKLGIACDCYISNRPAIFLYALDIIKLIQFFNSLTIRGLQGYIFCLPHHEQLVRDLFINYKKSVAVIVLEL